MKFYLEEVPVYFPYEYIYPEQHSYMLEIKRTLDATGHCVLEMPSGTGKTVALLSAITSYQLAHPEVGKLIYCSRTVGEIEKALEELKGITEYRDKCLREEGKEPPRLLSLGLSSRKNMCVHPEVAKEKIGHIVDSKCRNLTAPWVRDRAKEGKPAEVCDFYEGFDATGTDAMIPSGVYTIEDLKTFGAGKRWCPYFLARHMIGFANVIVYSFHYMLDPKIAKLVSKELNRDSIVVFDEAHNIDNVCIEALSVNFNRKTLDNAHRNVNTLTNKVNETREHDAAKLREEYERLVNGLVDRGVGDQVPAAVLPDDVVQDAIPGNIRRAVHFVGMLRRLIDYLRMRMRVQHVVSESPALFLHNLFEHSQIDSKTLRYCSDRLGSLLRTLEIPDMDRFSALVLVCQFATLMGTYSKGFRLIIEPYDERTPTIPDPVLELCCLDASLAIRPVFDRFRSVIITSGTLSPVDMYPRILDFRPVSVQSYSMSLTRNCVMPLVVTRGSDQVVISSQFKVRHDLAVVRNFGALLLEMCKVIPDGIVCFFTSYEYLEEVVATWNDMGFLKQITQFKLLFVETGNMAETSLALDLYRKACDSGRGAVLLSVARGKVSEGIDFDNHYGRCVIMFGIPYVYTESKVLKARLEFLRDQFHIRENDFLTFDAMRVAAQCVGRVIRSKRDYGIMILADKRYSRSDKNTKLPAWIVQHLQDSRKNLSTDSAVSLSRTFLREMAQPWSQQDQIGRAMLSLEQVQALPASRGPAPPPQPPAENGAAAADMDLGNDDADADDDALAPAAPPANDSMDLTA